MSFDSLYLYNVTLQPPSSSVAAVAGQFLGKRSQEIVIASGSALQLWRASSSTGKLSKLFHQDAFGAIRAITAFRLAGLSKDFLAVTSDSGKLSVLEVNAQASKFEIVFNEPFAKTGMRRLSPGQYLVPDAKGRAIMLTAVEKNKLVYVLNRDSSNSLTISSPLEANRNRILTFASCGLDVGYENPLFASIEVDYGDYELTNANSQDDNGLAPQFKKSLTFYELDLGLNHVVKKNTEVVSHSSNFILAIPGGNDGPSGVLIGCESFIQYKPSNSSGKTLTLPIPKRVDQVNLNYKTNYIISGVVHIMKKPKTGELGSVFFVLLQSNFGDLFKVTFNYKNVESFSVKSMDIKYFDTIPICNNLIILKSGFLFADTQSSNKLFYQFIKLGDDDIETVFNSEDYFNTTEEIDDVTFKPKPLDNLQLVDTIKGLNPIIDSKLIQNSDDLSEQRKLVTINGISANSTIKTLAHGLTVQEMVTSELPSAATGVFTTKLTSKDEFDRYLVISFPSSTLVLSIGESVEEVSDSNFELERETIGVQQMGLNSLLQIHFDGVVHLNFDGEGNSYKVNEWFPPAGIKITTCTSTNYQLAVGLSNRELVYFELNDEEKLIEYQERKEMPGRILSLSLGDIPEGKLRSNFLAVSCNNQTLQIFSVDPSNMLELVTIQALSSNASSVLLLLMVDSMISNAANNNSFKSYLLYLHIGLETGIYVKTLVNQNTGAVSDKIVQYMGPYALRLSKVEVGPSAENSVLISCPLQTGSGSGSGSITGRSSIGFVSGTGFRVLPVAYDNHFTYGSSFHSEDCPHGLVGVAGDQLVILTLDDLSNEFKIDSVGLRFTPKRFEYFSRMEQLKKQKLLGTVEESSIATADDPEEAFYVIQTDANTVSPFTKAKESFEAEFDYSQIGYPRQASSTASCLQVIDPNIVIGGEEDDDDEEEEESEQKDSIASKTKVIQTINFQNNESLFGVIQVFFKNRNGSFLLVSLAENFSLSSSNSQLTASSKPSFYLKCYKILDDLKLDFIHQTQVEAPVVSLAEFCGRLLVGMGKTLRLYDIGQKQLLRKAEIVLQNLNNIVKLTTQGLRVYVADIRESMTFVVYKPKQNIFIPFVDDSIKRHVTAFTTLDYDTVVGGDKFGNLWVLRCPEEPSSLSDEDTTGVFVSAQDSYLGGTPYRLQMPCHYYLNDIPTSFHKSKDASGLNDSVIYTGLQGTVGVLVPLLSRSEIKFFQALEKQLSENVRELMLVGRDHLMYRSYYAPAKGVIDGDLCEKFSLLSEGAKNKIALEMDRSVKDIEKKILDIRLKISI